MASMGGANNHFDVEVVLARLKHLLVRNLSTICRAEGVISSGVKADLQHRISELVKRYAAAGDTIRFQRLREMIANPDIVGQLTGNARAGQFSSSPAAASPRPGVGVSNGYNMPTVNGYRSQLNIEFKPSPFYSMKRQLGEIMPCEVMSQHRNTVSVKIRTMDDPVLEEVQNDRDKCLRIMVFCAAEAGGYNKQDVAFPHQCEIKVNGGDFKANLRGLKNKPGSTRPADITDALRLKPSTYTNSVDLTYALTNKAGPPFQEKFYMAVWIVQKVLVVDLVRKLANGKKISRNTVLKEMVAKAQDPDIVTTSTVLSLKCPLSTLRIDLPCRSTTCRHNQCFDATSYLQLQEQAPTWQCPLCNNPAPFDSLAVDEYLKDILSNTSKSIDQVTVEPDGKWSTNAKGDGPSQTSRAPNGFGSDGDEDLIEITDARVASLKRSDAAQPSTPVIAMRTPSISSREPSTAPLRASSSKRPISQVIDLTLSDDDDEEAPPTKKQSTGYGTPMSMHQARPSC